MKSPMPDNVLRNRRRHSKEGSNLGPPCLLASVRAAEPGGNALPPPEPGHRRGLGAVNDLAAHHAMRHRGKRVVGLGKGTAGSLRGGVSPAWRIAGEGPALGCGVGCAPHRDHQRRRRAGWSGPSRDVPVSARRDEHERSAEHAERQAAACCSPACREDLHVDWTPERWLRILNQESNPDHDQITTSALCSPRRRWASRSAAPANRDHDNSEYGLPASVRARCGGYGLRPDESALCLSGRRFRRGTGMKPGNAVLACAYHVTLRKDAHCDQRARPLLVTGHTRVTLPLRGGQAVRVDPRQLLTPRREHRPVDSQMIHRGWPVCGCHTQYADLLRRPAAARRLAGTAKMSLDSGIHDRSPACHLAMLLLMLSGRADYHWGSAGCLPFLGHGSCICECPSRHAAIGAAEPGNLPEIALEF